MSLLNSLTDELKAAMRAKDSLKLEALRAIKSEVLLAKTARARDTDLSEEEEIKLLQKLVKQRKDSAGIFRQQNRDDLAAPEEAQADVIGQFLPKQLSSDVIEKIIDEIKITPVEYADEVLKIALTKELKKTEWVEVDMTKKDDKSQASIQ